MINILLHIGMTIVGIVGSILGFILLVFIIASCKSSSNSKQDYEDEGYSTDPNSLDDDIKMDELFDAMCDDGDENEKQKSYK